jgi:hypothetical protein
LTSVAAVDAPAGTTAGTVAGHPPDGLLFLTAGTSTPADIVAVATSSLDAVATIVAPASTTASAASSWATAAVAPAGTTTGGHA